MASFQAEVELNRKLRFEARLRRELVSIWRKQAETFARSFAVFSIIPNLHEEQREIEIVLFEHYKRVSKRFGFRIRRNLPKNLAMTFEERHRFDQAMSMAFAQRAMGQAALITHTTEKLMDESVGNAGIVLEGTNPNASRTELANMAASMFLQRSRVRANTIACYETQWAAEASKFAEVSVLVGININIKQSPRKQTFKRWDTVGDNRVRDHHLAVDGVIVPADQPFTVNGEQLLYPGDSSLGASAGNIINCRCGAVYEVDSIAEARQDLSSFRSIADLVRDLNVLFGGQ